MIHPTKTTKVSESYKASVIALNCLHNSPLFLLLKITNRPSNTNCSLVIIQAITRNKHNRKKIATLSRSRRAARGLKEIDGVTEEIGIIRAKRLGGATEDVTPGT
jgi:hypothetical protein